MIQIQDFSNYKYVIMLHSTPPKTGVHGTWS